MWTDCKGIIGYRIGGCDAQYRDIREPIPGNSGTFQFGDSEAEFVARRLRPLKIEPAAVPAAEPPPPAPAAHAELQDRDGDGKITAADLGPNFKTHFAEFDKNKDGELDADEQAAAIQKLKAQKAAGAKPGAQGGGSQGTAMKGDGKKAGASKGPAKGGKKKPAGG